MMVAELKGALLDYWVARACAYVAELEPDVCSVPGLPDELQLQGIRGGTSDIYSPSRYWEQGGPIIEREGITLCFSGNVVANNKWEAYTGAMQTYDGLEGDHMAVGPTPLIAAMRVYVTSKFGDEVAADTKQLDSKQTKQ
jgi:hypothetical protein